jgi:putative peptidoglycan lipid II flippase
MDTSNRLSETENMNVAKAAGIVSLATMLSRICGFIRDMVVAAFFGAGLVTDAFWVAFRIPNLLRRLLGEGSLTVSFVPIFIEYLKSRTKEEAYELADTTFTLLSIILVIVCIVGIIFSPAIVSVIAFGFAKNREQFELAVFLTRLMFPYIFFISLVALCMGILNSLRHFTVPALSPVILNISMIFSTLLLRNHFQEPIVALAVGVMIGGVLQLAMQWPILVRLGVRLKLNFHFRHPGLKKIGKLLFPAFLVSATYQINVFVGTVLASMLPTGSVSYLYYADRILELPLGVFAIAVGTASLPSFSTLATKGDITGLKKTLSFTLRMILFVTVPAMIGLIALREPIISVLFQRGEFNILSTVMTAKALLYYSLGLWAYSIVRVIDSAFFALQDRKAPLKAAYFSLLVNIVLSIILMYPLKHGGLALANSIASAVNVAMLAIILKKKIGVYLDQHFYRSVSKFVLSSLLMWVVIALVDLILPWSNSASFAYRFSTLALEIGLGSISYMLFSFLFKSTEYVMVYQALRIKLGRLFR